MQSGCRLGELKRLFAWTSVCMYVFVVCKILKISFLLMVFPFSPLFFITQILFSYGIFSFGLIFLVEGRGILQATLTLNGLVGGILLGLFSLGIFFKQANVKVSREWFLKSMKVKCKFAGSVLRWIDVDRMRHLPRCDCTDQKCRCAFLAFVCV
jgi:hypothetical protein